MKRTINLTALSLLVGLSACGGGSDKEVLREVKLQEALATELKPVSSADQLANYLRNGVLAQAGNGIVSDPLADIATPGLESSDFSTTNLQMPGVDESDKVKYDGNYLYIANAPSTFYDWGSLAADGPLTFNPDEYAQIRIMQTDTEVPSSEEAAVYSISSPGINIEGMYLDLADEASSAQMSVVTSSVYSYWPFDLWFSPWYWTDGRTGLHLLDLSQPTMPVESFKLEIEGHLIASRKIGDQIYLVTRFSPQIEGLIYNPADDNEKLENQRLVDRMPLSDFMPQVRINGNNESNLLAASDCYLPESTSEDEGYTSLITITTINTQSQTVNAQCITGNNHGVFASTTGIYLIASAADETAFHKFGLATDDTRYLDTGYVKGDLGWRNPLFRIGENNGVLQVFSSFFDPASTPSLQHRLTMLDSPMQDGESFNELAALPNDSRPQPIGKPGEDIFAVRYVGDRGYAVTFEQIDPLYAFDLSDASDPRIAGELEIPGVSHQLHPLAEGFLVGIGHEVEAGNPNLMQGIKVELFDVRDMTNPQSVGSVVYGERGTRSEAIYDHHLFSVLSLDADNHRMTLPVVLHDTLPPGADPATFDSWYDWTNYGLQMLDINTGDQPSISSAGAMITSSNEESQYPEYDWLQRSVIHGDATFFINLGQVWSADWNNPDQLDGPK